MVTTRQLRRKLLIWYQKVKKIAKTPCKKYKDMILYQSWVRIAQLDRASDYGSEGQEFESSCARRQNPLKFKV